VCVLVFNVKKPQCVIDLLTQWKIKSSTGRDGLLGLLSVNLEAPPPPRRRRLDPEGSFDGTGPQETVPDPSPRGEHSFSEGPTISNLGAEALSPYNSPITDLSTTLLIQIFPPRVTHHERQIILQVVI
jgi:hypothetical protein